MKSDKKALKYKYRKPGGRYECVDPRPLSIPVGLEKPESLQEKLVRLVRNEVFAQDLANKDIESFKEADDFDISDDPIDPTTPYEENFDPHGMTAREQEVRAGLVKEPNPDVYLNALKTIKDYEEALKASRSSRRREGDKPAAAPKRRTTDKEASK